MHRRHDARIRAPGAARLAAVASLAAGLLACGGDSGGEYVARPANTLTYSRDIAPILHERCAGCHGPAPLVPPDLSTYESVRGEAARIVAAVRSGRMPPWPPELRSGEFEGERRLSTTEVGMIGQWVEEGAAQGEPSDLPSAAGAAAGWRLGEPDLVIEMPEPYELDADGDEVLRSFVLPVPVDGTRWVEAVEFRPGNPRAVRGARIALARGRAARRFDAEDPGPGYDGRFATGAAANPDGFLLAWMPGAVPRPGRDSIAWRLEPGASLVLELRLRPTGRPETVRAEVGLHFAPGPPARRPALLRLGSRTIDIAPGERDYQVTDSYTLPVDVNVLSVYPRARHLARAVQAHAVLPDGTMRSLIRIDDWRFEWQGEYRYREPIFLPRGTKLFMRYTYDNSGSNPHNPSVPPVRVVYGPRSVDEAADLWIQVLPQDSAALALLKEDFARKELRALADGYEFLARLHPESARVQYALGNVLMDRGDARGAITRYRKALAIDPGLVEAHYNLGNALAATGAFTDAVAEYQLALDGDPRFASAHYNLADVFQSLGMLDDAIEHYRRALRLEPRLAKAHNNLGLALVTRGAVDSAIAEYRRAIDADPTLVSAYNNLANALQSQGKIDEALAILRQALAVDPDNAQANYNLALGLEWQGRYEAAVPHLQKVVAARPADQTMHHALGLALVRAGRPTEGLREFEEAARLKPGWTLPLYSIAWVLATHPSAEVRNPRRAIQVAERAAGLTAYRHPLVLDALAAAYASAGQFDKAVTAMERAVAVAGDPQLAARLRARLELYRAGRPYRDSTMP